MEVEEEQLRVLLGPRQILTYESTISPELYHELRNDAWRREMEEKRHVLRIKTDQDVGGRNKARVDGYGDLAKHATMLLEHGLAAVQAAGATLPCTFFSEDTRELLFRMKIHRKHVVFVTEKLIQSLQDVLGVKIVVCNSARKHEEPVVLVKGRGICVALAWQVLCRVIQLKDKLCNGKAVGVVFLLIHRGARLEPRALPVGPMPEHRTRLESRSSSLSRCVPRIPGPPPPRPYDAPPNWPPLPPPLNTQQPMVQLPCPPSAQAPPPLHTGPPMVPLYPPPPNTPPPGQLLPGPTNTQQHSHDAFPTGGSPPPPPFNGDMRQPSVSLGAPARSHHLHQPNQASQVISELQNLSLGGNVDMMDVVNEGDGSEDGTSAGGMASFLPSNPDLLTLPSWPTPSRDSSTPATLTHEAETSHRTADEGGISMDVESPREQTSIAADDRLPGTADDTATGVPHKPPSPPASSSALSSAGMGGMSSSPVSESGPQDGSPAMASPAVSAAPLVRSSPLLLHDDGAEGQHQTGTQDKVWEKGRAIGVTDSGDNEDRGAPPHGVGEGEAANGKGKGKAKAKAKREGEGARGAGGKGGKENLEGNANAEGAASTSAQEPRRSDRNKEKAKKREKEAEFLSKYIHMELTNPDNKSEAKVILRQIQQVLDTDPMLKDEEMRADSYDSPTDDRYTVVLLDKKSGKLAGFATCQVKTDDAFYLEAFAAVIERNGIGGWLLEHLMALATRKGLSFTARVRAKNTRCIGCLQIIAGRCGRTFDLVPEDEEEKANIYVNSAERLRKYKNKEIPAGEYPATEKDLEDLKSAAALDTKYGMLRLYRMSRKSECMDGEGHT